MDELWKNRRTEILALHIEGRKLSDIAAIFDVSRQRIFQIIKQQGSSSLIKKNEKTRKDFIIKTLRLPLSFDLDKAETFFKTGKDLRYLRKKDKITLKRHFGDCFTVFRNGWPDYLIKKNEKWICVEIKHPGDKLKPEQFFMKKFFEAIGIEYKVLP